MIDRLGTNTYNRGSAMAFLVNFILSLSQVLTYAIIAKALISWFPVSPYNPVMRLLNQITEPLLYPLRRVVPRLGMLDITPLVAILILQAIPFLLSLFLT